MNTALVHVPNSAEPIESTWHVEIILKSFNLTLLSKVFMNICNSVIVYMLA